MPDDAIAKLERYLQTVPIQFKSMPTDLQSEKPVREKWSKKEILGHLIDSAINNLQRFTTITFSPQPFEIIPYQQAELVLANRYQEQSERSLLSLWQSLNEQIVNVWKNYSTSDLELTVVLPGQEQSGTLLWWINDYTTHLEHHLKQIFGALDILQSPPEWQIGVEAAIRQLKAAGEKRFVTLLEHGTMSVEYYAPQKVDLQSPHRQDELYVVQQGSGIFYNHGKQNPFTAGDVLFVPAGVEHRFEDFTEDFSTWVIFYGPDGGESVE